MEGSSKNPGGETRTRLQKRRQAKEEETRVKRQRQEKRFLRAVQDKVIRPHDMLVDSTLQKVVFPPEEGEEEDVKVKVEPVEDMDEFIHVEVLNVSGGGRDAEPVVPGNRAGVTPTAGPSPGHGKTTKFIEGHLRLIVDEVQNLPPEVQTCEKFRGTLREILSPILALLAAPPGDHDLGNGDASSESVPSAPQSQDVVMVGNAVIGDDGMHSESSNRPVNSRLSAAEIALRNDQEKMAELRELNAKLGARLAALNAIPFPVSDATVRRYVKSWDPVTKHLHLYTLSCERGPSENAVLSRHVGVETLEVNIAKGKWESDIKIPLPNLFQHLRSLDIFLVMGRVDSCIEACLSACQNLESLTLPRMDKEQLNNVLVNLRRKLSAGNSRLKEIDFVNVAASLKFDPCTSSGSTTNINESPAFLDFVRACAEHEVGISNPCTSWTPADSADKQLLGNCIKSLQFGGDNSIDYLWDVPLEQLESLSIAPSGHWIHNMHQKMAVHHQKPPVKWTHLSKLDARLVSDAYQPFLYNPSREELAFFFTFLVKQSPNLKELRVEGHEDRVSFLLAAPLLRQWSLRKLTLCNVPGKCKFLKKRWAELDYLEELTLERLAPWDAAWYKLKTSTFLQLKNLRKLWILDMDEVLDTHDKFLRNVISKMQLTHLVITLKTPFADVNLIPRPVIQSLISGPLGQSVQELSINEWSLKDITGRDPSEHRDSRG